MIYFLYSLIERRGKYALSSFNRIKIRKIHRVCNQQLFLLRFYTTIFFRTSTQSDKQREKNS
jgi:hypothetical protein